MWNDMHLMLVVLFYPTTLISLLIRIKMLFRNWVCSSVLKWSKTFFNYEIKLLRPKLYFFLKSVICLFVWYFWDSISLGSHWLALCRAGLPWTHWDLYANTYWVLVLKVWHNYIYWGGQMKFSNLGQQYSLEEPNRI